MATKPTIPKLRRGTIFDTKYEFGCVVIEEPDESGSFAALDSDDVECSYGVAMVIRTYTTLQEYLRALRSEGC